MHSRNRAWLMTILLVLVWRLVITGPFTYFADMIKDGAALLAGLLPVSAAVQNLLVYVLLSVVLIILLLLGRTRHRLYLAGFCALAEVIHHLVLCIRTNQLYPASLSIVIALSLALVFLLLHSKSPGLWLSDAFIMAIPVWLICDSLITVLYGVFHLKDGFFGSLIPRPESSLLIQLDDFLQLPWQLWAIIPLALAVVPLVFLTDKRQKG